MIGTHGLFSSRVKFHRLGLLIIDEEHRFGVKQKEKLRLKRTQVDTISLSATPIPRSLHMSLSGVRDISLINNAPPDRRRIKTRVLQFDEHLISEVIRRELRRQGQVFFVHNRVETIDKIYQQLSSLVPEAKIGIAHGKLDKQELSTVMNKFVAKDYTVLLASTIIESGLDIPNANSLIVNEAHRLGLAQLYQLRGRVGRSATQAYAYYLLPFKLEDKTMAHKRLQAMQEFVEPGAGFKIANYDLQLRAERATFLVLNNRVILRLWG